VQKLIALLLLAVVGVVAAGCGTASAVRTTTPQHAAADPAASIGGHTLYRGGNWAVVAKGDTAVALHLVGGVWHPDRRGRVKVELLGPHGIQPPTTQVAAQLIAPTRLVESGLWVDGVELVEKGGGLTPTRGTIYGATNGLAKGRHVVVAYARTASAATAIARTFTVG
jgi:hypothetical protein